MENLKIDSIFGGGFSFSSIFFTENYEIFGSGQINQNKSEFLKYQLNEICFV